MAGNVGSGGKVALTVRVTKKTLTEKCVCIETFGRSEFRWNIPVIYSNIQYYTVILRFTSLIRSSKTSRGVTPRNTKTNLPLLCTYKF